MNDATKRECIVLSRGPFTVNIVFVLGFVDISYQEGEDVAKNLMVVLWHFLCPRIFAQEHEVFVFCVSSAQFCTQAR